jgi:3-oxoacyl-[acyl-carrier-protein] synthase-1
MEILATGMVSPVGLSAATNCAAYRAGMSLLQELAYFDYEGEPIIGGAVPGVPEDFEAGERLTSLLALALEDLLNEKMPIPLERVPLFVGVAEPERPGLNKEFSRGVVKRIQEILRVRFHPELSEIVPTGHTAGFQALEKARALLRNGQATVCIIAGVDSYLNLPSLRWLEESGRLKGPKNSNGVIPGEAAAAVAVGAQRGSQAVRIVGLGFAREQVTVLSEEPFQARGLAEAAKKALAQSGLSLHDIAFRLSDATGESYGFKELALLLSRVLRRRMEEMPVWHWAEAIGDVGAAAGICELVLATHAFGKGYAPGSRALCLTSSVPGDRAALILEHVATTGTFSALKIRS